MNLSYTLRLVCILIVVGGLTHCASQLVVALGCRIIQRRLETMSARLQERILYLIQIGPVLLSACVAVLLCMPAYLHSEPNREIESVSLICLVLATGFGLWFVLACFRGLRITLRALRFANECRRSGQIFLQVGELPVLLVPNLRLPVALVGFHNPIVVVSAEFAEMVDLLDPDILAIALAHERAHATHWDNLKLLCLAFLPKFDLLLPRGRRWHELWQRAADWAADDEATLFNRSRALQLAEALVQAARCVHTSHPPAPCLALTSAEAGLVARIERLTDPQHVSHPDGTALIPCLAILALFGSALAAIPWIYTLSERLLHLGGS